jgi:hypothetical protein
MLTPDVTQTEGYLRSSVSAASTVTNYAQAAITAVPTIPNPPDWFVPIQNDLTTAQGHANNWLQQICAAVTANVPGGIIDFNEKFQSKSQQILDIQQAVEGEGQPTAQQRQNVGSLLKDLSTAIVEQKSAIDSLQKSIKTYFGQVQGDQNNLGADLGTVSERFVRGHVWVEQLTAAIGEGFLDSSMLGPCIAIVEININVSLKIGGVGADPTLITLIFAKAILDNQISNSQVTQQAIQNVLDTWTTLKVKNEAVISDLKDAQDSQYVEILSQVDLETGQTQWQQLADFATSLVNPAQGAQGAGA